MKLTFSILIRGLKNYLLKYLFVRLIFFAIYEYTVLTEYQCIRQGIPGKVYVKDGLIQITNDLIIKFVSM